MSYLRYSIAAALLSALLSACENYDFKVNEKVVYSPTPLFTDFTTDDTALQSCLEQAITDQAVRAANQLEALNCSHAGIAKLEGLSVFTGIRILKLSSNEIRNLVDLGMISTLEIIHLDNNRVIDPVPLYQLNALRYLDLSGNPELQCPDRGAFLQVETLALPDHCL